MKISVIVTSYNYAQYIEEVITSVINQSYSNWELIIVDDGSNDNSVEIIKSFSEKDNRIKFFQHENGENKGLKESLLLGIKHATGDWIAFLESDDFFMPENLSRKVEIIKKYPEIGLIFNKVKFISDKQQMRQLTFEIAQKKLDKIIFPRNMFKDFYINNIILTFSCVMVKTESLSLEYFNSPNDSLLDWWIWIHLAKENEFYYINEELVNWNLHENSYITNSKKPIFIPIQARAYIDVYKNKREIKLLLFIIYLFIILFFVRIYRFINSFFRKINNFVKKRS